MIYDGYNHLYDGDEHFLNDGMPVNRTVSDFWHWCCSDLLNNTMRGALAEYLVATALEIPTDTYRVGWNAFDLIYAQDASDHFLEIKCSAYLQSWNQAGFSKISFGIAPPVEEPDLVPARRNSPRIADAYIFCLYNHRDRATADITHLEQWEFWICPTSMLNEHCGNQKQLSLSVLLQLCPYHATYGTLKRTVDELCQNRLI